MGKGFPEEWLKNTFGLASALNGAMAIVAGFLAQVSADMQGEIGPFQLAILLTVLALVLVTFLWDENYGEEKKDETTSSTWRVVSDKRILLVAASTSLFEGSMYTFVFMWVPTLLGLTKEPLPTGLVFSCFMCCITIGGLLFERAKSIVVEKLAIAVFRSPRCRWPFPSSRGTLWSSSLHSSALRLRSECSSPAVARSAPGTFRTSCKARR